MKDSDKNLKYDYDYSRATYYELIDKGRESLDLLIEVARETEHPRAFEVLSNMIKNLSDVNDKLMDLNKKVKDIKQEPKNAQLEAPKTTNNIFLGSTTDLQRILQQEREIDVTPKSE
jgi:hypothetical protein